jgi:hypothetical protein
MHQVLRDDERIAGLKTQFERMRTARDLQKGELVALRRFCDPPRANKAEFAVPSDGSIEVADTNTGVKEYWHGGRSCCSDTHLDPTVPPPQALSTAGFFLAIKGRVFKPSCPLVVCVVCLVDCQMNVGSVVIRNSMVGNGQKIGSSILP